MMADEKLTKCRLCQSELLTELPVSVIHRTYFLCQNCQLIQVGKEYIPTPSQEKSRYDLHQNSEDNKGYLHFLNQAMVSLNPFLNSEMQGLDYGCGPNPVLANYLVSKGQSIDNYDPFYFPNLPKKSYDYVFCTEVVEHFANPFAEWSKMLTFLKPQGYLCVMTEIWNQETELKNWHYLRDFTHLSFYHSQSLEYIAANFNVDLVYSDKKRVFIFCKK